MRHICILAALCIALLACNAYAQDNDNENTDAEMTEEEMTPAEKAAEDYPHIERPVYIAPIGDSITHGGRKNREEWTYRYPLFCMLKKDDVEFDFIGSMTKGLHRDLEWPDCNGEPFDPDHEGHYGIKTGKLAANLEEWMEKWDHAPDIALIHLGTNDQKAESPDEYDETVVKPLTEIIGMLREENPQVIVLVGHLNFDAGAAVKIRPKVEKMAEELNTEKSPVITVHHYKDFNENPKHEETDTYDWAHPNPQGQKKMAEKWYEAMKPFLAK
jgi:hypothetical protein